EHWGGYILKPRRMEFWIGRPGRLHDRFEFVRSGASPSTLPMPTGPGVPNWTFRRLYP
ncbi:MAG: pyridoxine 5'-phosphate oxidase C-terminal domain-containing protein, partial [Bdellovibrionales bacterium]